MDQDSSQFLRKIGTLLLGSLVALAVCFTYPVLCVLFQLFPAPPAPGAPARVVVFWACFGLAARRAVAHSWLRAILSGLRSGVGQTRKRVCLGNNVRHDNGGSWSQSCDRHPHPPLA